MKSFLIVLKNGFSFTIKAARIEDVGGLAIKVYSEEDSDNAHRDVYIRPSEVIAILPTEILVTENKPST